MKKNILILILTCTIAFLWSCEKKLELVNSVSTTEGMAFLKIVHAAPAFRQIVNDRDSFNVYVSGIKLNGALLTYNSVFPTITNLYVAVPSGLQSIRLTANSKATPDSLTLGYFPKTFEPGAYYSLIITDSLLKGKDSKQMFLKDEFALTDTNNYTIRFVNAVLNDPVAVDVYSFRKAKNIFSSISPTTATPFIQLPYTILSDTLYVRPTGTQTDIAKITIANGSTTALNRRRPYTLLYRGQNGGTGTKVRGLTLYAND